MRFSSLNFQEISHVNSQERGFSYGDGHFTTARIHKGQIQFLHAHLERLQHGNEALFLGNVEWQKLAIYVKSVAASFDEGVLKIVITAGSGGRGYARDENAQPNVYVFVYDTVAHYVDWKRNGISLGVATFQLGDNPALAGIKHLNRLEQVLIRRELDTRYEQELLVTDLQGFIVEASCSNVFWFDGQQWFTPSITGAGIAGVMRSKLMNLLPDVKLVNSRINVLSGAMSMFVCNSVMQVVPVATFQGQSLDMAPVRDIINRFERYAN
ncbi:aminodeoxychorismate lyase [Thalassotalea fusca]